jgi:hypothetical protein
MSACRTIEKFRGELDLRAPLRAHAARRVGFMSSYEFTGAVQPMNPHSYCLAWVIDPNTNMAAPLCSRRVVLKEKDFVETPNVPAHWCVLSWRVARLCRSFNVADSGTRPKSCLLDLDQISSVLTITIRPLKQDGLAIQQQSFVAGKSERISYGVIVQPTL